MRETRLPSVNPFALGLLYAVLAIPAQLYFRIRCDNRHAFARDPQRPRVIVFNHASHLDVLLVSYCIGFRRSLRMLTVAKQELFKNALFGGFIRRVGAFPVDREAKDLQAIRVILQLLQQGNTLLIAPEGTRTETGEVGVFNSTFIRLAQKANALILPIGLHGTFKAFPKGSHFPHPAKITVRCGAEIDLAHYPGQSQDELSEMVRQQVIRLSMG